MLSIVIDAQAGSCGKGKVAAFLALRDQPSIVAASFGPNAGHTVRLDGKKLVFRHLPAGSVHPGARIMIGASAIIDLPVLMEEIRSVEEAGIPIKSRLAIHPRAAVITEEDRAEEARLLRGISSTMKGVGAAQARKLMRTAKLADSHSYLSEYTKRWDYDALPTALDDGEPVLVETSQGFDLCLNHGVSYPFCTSRQINVSQVLADLALPPDSNPFVYGVMRPYPIRVGNISDSETSGPYADDTTEITWKQVAMQAGMPPDAVAELLEQEKTTVTGRQRRVFTFSFKRFRQFCMINHPAALALNFADQVSWSNRTAKSMEELSEDTIEFIDKVESIVNVAPFAEDFCTKVELVGTGPDNSQMIDRFGSLER